MPTELNSNLFGGYDTIEFEGVDELREVCAMLDEMTPEARKFILAYMMKRMDT